MALRADLRGPDGAFNEQRIVGAGTAVTEQPLARGCMDRRGRRFDLLQKRSWQLPEHRVNAKELSALCRIQLAPLSLKDAHKVAPVESTACRSPQLRSVGRKICAQSSCVASAGDRDTHYSVSLHFLTVTRHRVPAGSTRSAPGRRFRFQEMYKGIRRMVTGGALRRAFVSRFAADSETGHGIFVARPIT